MSETDNVIASSCIMMQGKKEIGRKLSRSDSVGILRIYIRIVECNYERRIYFFHYTTQDIKQKRIITDPARYFSAQKDATQMISSCKYCLLTLNKVINISGQSGA